MGKIDPGRKISIQLLRSAQEGNSAALEALAARYRLPLLRWARGRLPRWARDLVNTEDVVQESLVRAIRRVGAFEYRHEGAFHAYLREVVRNRIRDEVRRAQRRPQCDTLLSDAAPDERSPLEELIGQEALQIYEDAFRSLRSAEQEAVTARIELGLSYAEVAESTGKPSEDAARMAVSRALIKLARRMAEIRRNVGERTES